VQIESTQSVPLPLCRTDAPADAAEAAEAIRQAAADGLAVYPIGGATALGYGGRPVRPGIGLQLARLNRVIDYVPDDMTITVEAGLTMADLSRHLARRRQRLPLDVARPERATIGGTLATAPSHPRQHAYGTIRDYVLGLGAIDGCGTPFSAGGRVVKNAAGYNLCRLMAGALGTLGVVTQVTLMVRPVPETGTILACEPEDLDQTERLLDGLSRSDVLPAAVELAYGPARRAVPGLDAGRPAAAGRLLVGLEGSQAEVEDASRRLVDQWRQLGVQNATQVAPDAAAAAWEWMVSFPGGLEVHVRPGRVVETVARLRGIDPGMSIQARAGCGVIEAQLSPREPADFAAVLREKIRPAVAETGGNVAVLRQPEGMELAAADVWGPPGTEAAIMRAIKERFDPAAILNPGRFAWQ
jgi:glycolate oxidase FAD binding subunit